MADYICECYSTDTGEPLSGVEIGSFLSTPDEWHYFAGGVGLGVVLGIGLGIGVMIVAYQLSKRKGIG